MDDQKVLIAQVSSRNPVPSVDDPPVGLLDRDAVHREVMRRTRTMKTQERLTEISSQPRRRGLWVAAGAFALVVVVGAAVALFGGGEPDTGPPVADPTTTVVETTTTSEAPTTTTTEAPTTTTTAELTEDAMIAIVEDMIDVHNTGDFAAWQEFFGESPSVFGDEMISDEDWGFQRSFIAADEQWILTGDCAFTFGSTVACPVEGRNDFMAPAGLSYVIPQLRVILDPAGKIISIGADRWEIRGDPEDYFAAFDAWLAETHPEVHASFGDRVGDPVTGDNWGALPNAADMPTALQYVDEFLAQSDVYPLTD